MTRAQAEAKLIDVMNECNEGPKEAKAYVVLWEGRWPLIAEMGWATSNAGAAFMRSDEEAAPAIIAAESFLAALMDNEDLEHVEETLRGRLK